MRDLDFISARYAEYRLSKEQRYLAKYFKTPQQKAFLKYYMVFGDWCCFIDHTGLWVSKSYLIRLEQTLVKLVAAHAEAKASKDMGTLMKIESGKYKKNA